MLLLKVWSFCQVVFLIRRENVCTESLCAHVQLFLQHRRFHCHFAWFPWFPDNLIPNCIANFKTNFRQREHRQATQEKLEAFWSSVRFARTNYQSQVSEVFHFFITNNDCIIPLISWQRWLVFHSWKMPCSHNALRFHNRIWFLVNL